MKEIGEKRNEGHAGTCGYLTEGRGSIIPVKRVIARYAHARALRAMLRGLRTRGHEDRMTLYACPRTGVPVFSVSRCPHDTLKVAGQQETCPGVDVGPQDTTGHPG